MTEWLLFLMFVLALAAILLKDRKNVKREGIIFIRRTLTGVDFIDKIANRWPRFWKVMAVIGVVAAIGGMIFASYFIISAAMNVAAGGAAGVKIVLPAPVSNAVSAPAVLLMPWYFWVIGILSLTIPHEFSHGIISRLNKLRVKTVGWFFLIIIPGAFVEPDDKQLKAAKAWTKIKVYSAGSFANFVVAFVVFAIMLVYVPMTLHTTGLMPAYYELGMPMADINATGAILSVNNIGITSQEALADTLLVIPPNSTINVETTKGNFTIQTAAHELRNGSRIGVIGPYVEYREINNEFRNTVAEPVVFFFGQMFDWILLLNLGVGLINLLPLKPLDGGFIMESVIEKALGRGKRRTKICVRAISAAFLLLLVYSVFGGFLR